MNIIQTLDKKTFVSIDQIIAIENELKKHEQVELPIEHDFINGVYARTMHIPAGVILTGAVHRHDCFTVVRYGDISIYTDDGMKRFKTGDMIPSMAGIKRLGLSHAETLITGFMANPDNEKDAEKIWEYYTAPNDFLLESKEFEKLEI